MRCSVAGKGDGSLSDSAGARPFESVRVEVSCFEYQIHTPEMRQVIGMQVMVAHSIAPLTWGSFIVYFGLANKSETFAAPSILSVSKR